MEYHNQLSAHIKNELCDIAELQYKVNKLNYNVKKLKYNRKSNFIYSNLNLSLGIALTIILSIYLSR